MKLNKNEQDEEKSEMKTEAHKEQSTHEEDEGSSGEISPEKTRAVIIMALMNLKKIAWQNGLDLSDLLSEAGIYINNNTPPTLKG